MGTRQELEELVGLCASGGLRPLVDRVVPLEDARSAFVSLAAGEQRGKLVVRISSG
jgi:D-arabinose 1-dehydrogenase-like Zn-dependent alcohol dehydrogenase